MSDHKLAFLHTPEVERLSYPADCPFKTQRAGLTRQRLLSFGLLGGGRHTEVAPRMATVAELGRFHSARYVDELRRAAAGELTLDGLHMGLGGPDTPVFSDLFEYGSWACGAALTAADLLLSGEADIAFNLLGGFHHAMADRAAGFCYLNDVVLACMRLADGGRRVAYLDVDAHHGDGVQAAFYQRDDVLTISLHESGDTLFPWGGYEDEIGEGSGLGYNVNVSLPARIYDDAYLRAFDRVVMPVLDAYKPDVIVIEMGMDALAGDPLTHLTLTNNALMEALTRVLRLNKPLLVSGGGGYHVENTVRGWALAWRTCCGEDEHDIAWGMGGGMLANTEWVGGLRDYALAVMDDQRRAVDPAVRISIERVIRHVFPHHGLI